MRSSRVLRRVFLDGSVLFVLLGAAQLGWARCREKPTVFLDERTAATHLLAKIDPELPAPANQLALAEPVVLRVTVDRRGVICNLEPMSGPPELHRLARNTVKKHWRYRPFRLNWKRVVAQFPATVRFNPPRREPRVKSASNFVPGFGRSAVEEEDPCWAQASGSSGVFKLRE